MARDRLTFQQTLQCLQLTNRPLKEICHREDIPFNARSYRGTSSFLVPGS